MSKNRIYNQLILNFSLLFCLCFSSCKIFISLTQTQNGDVIAEFSGIPEQAFVNTITSFLEGDSLFIDTNEIKSFLIDSGFVDVTVSNQVGANVDIKMIIPKGKTFLFDSKLIFSDESNGNFGLKLSPATLQSFYANADDQIISILDILLSPAFYGEEIAE